MGDAAAAPGNAGINLNSSCLHPGTDVSSSRQADCPWLHLHPEPTGCGVLEVALD